MFPLPKEHWLPHQGVKQCMSCSSTFAKTLFGSSKENCRKCGRVVCKQCLTYKIKDVRVCTECYQLKENSQINEMRKRNYVPSLIIKRNKKKAISIPTKDLYTEYQERSNNPYLSEDSLKQYQEQFNLHIPAPMRTDRTRSHSSVLSTTSTVPIPQSLLDLTTAIPMPSNNVPTSSIPSALKELPEHEDTEEKAFELIKSVSTTPKRKSFRERKGIDVQHNRKQSASVGNIGLSASRSSVCSNASNTSNGSYSTKGKSINIIPWIDQNDIFEIDEKRMKSFEDKSYTRSKIKCSVPMIIRLDGFEFGMFTSKMDKPFDKRLHSALVMTGCDLLKEFDAYSVFVQSDEIILMYPPNHHKMKGFYLFGGKVAKIVSIVASFASIRFVHHLQRETFSDNMELEKDIKNCFASFNGKCFNVGNNDDIFDYIIWRLKSNITGYHKKILTADTEFCHGTFIKKEKYRNKKKERERITSCCVQIESKDNKYRQLLVDKYWNNTFLDKENQLKIPPKSNSNKNKLSFDDDDVFPDIYNTVIVHDINQKDNGERVVMPSGIESKKVKPQIYKIKAKKDVIPKRKSLPIKRNVDAITARFESQKRKNKKIENKSVFITPEINIYDDNHMYDTMIIHDIDTKKKTAQINIKPKQKVFFKPKAKAYHRPPSNGRIQPPKPSKPLPVPKPSKSPPHSPSNTQQIIKPAAANPNYKYNYNINLKHIKPKESPKQMSAKERIRLMNQRLQNIKQQK